MKGWQFTRTGALLRAAAGLISDPDPRLAAVEAGALSSALPQFARTVPAGALTWDTRVTYLATEEESQPMRLDFGARVLLAGLFITATGAERGDEAPSLELLDLAVENDSAQRWYTSRRQQNGGNRTGFVPALALDARHRFLNLLLDEPSPSLIFRARGRWAAAGSNGFANSVIVSVTAFGTPIEE